MRRACRHGRRRQITDARPSVEGWAPQTAQVRPQRTKSPVLTGKGFGKKSENLSTRVSGQRPDSAIPRGNTPVHADYSSEAYLFSVGTLAPRVLTMLSSAASAFASSGLTGAFLQRGSVLCSAPNMASVIGIGAHPWSCSHTISNSVFALRDLQAPTPCGAPPQARLRLPPRTRLVRWDERPKTPCGRFVRAMNLDPVLDWSLCDGAVRCLQLVLSLAGGAGRPFVTLTSSIARQLGRTARTVQKLEPARRQRRDRANIRPQVGPGHGDGDEGRRAAAGSGEAFGLAAVAVAEGCFPTCPKRGCEIRCAH